LQATVAHVVAFLGIVPQVALVVVVAIAILDGRVWGTVFGAVTGLILDVAIGGHIGLNAILFMWIGFFTGLIYKEYFNNKYKVAMLFCVVADVIYSFIFYFLNIVILGSGDLGVALWHVILPEIIMTTIFCLPVFWCVDHATKRLRRI